MKKIVALSFLLVTSATFVFAGTNKLEPHTVVPVVKNDMNHHDQKAHHEAQNKHPQKTKEEYVKELLEKINDTKKFIEGKKATITQVQYDLAMKKVEFAEQWLKTIESYQDPVTRYVRSFYYGLSELDSSKRDVKRNKKEIKEKNDKIIKQMEEKIKELAAKKDFPFHAENEACFNQMIKLAEEYTKLAGMEEHKDNWKSLLKRAGKYLSDAKKFLKAHKSPKAHKHDDHTHIHHHHKHDNESHDDKKPSQEHTK